MASSQLKKEYRKVAWFMVILVAVIIIGVSISVSFGAANIDFFEVWQAIINPDLSQSSHAVINQVRLPRVLAGLLVGASLAVAGALMQGMTRNRLADSGLLGINGGSTLAIALCFALAPGLPYNQMLILSFIGAAISALVVFGISSSSKRGSTPFRLTMAGAVISSLLLALSQGVALYFNLSQDLAFWSAGGLAGVTWSQLAIATPLILLTLVISFVLSPYITILSLGDEVATSLGQRTFLIKFVSVIVILVLAGLAVSLVGNVAYVGLIVPHIVKLLVGGKYQYIIPCSALFGAAFILIADFAARLINAPQETPLGALTALIGVPFFIYLIKTRGRDS